MPFPDRRTAHVLLTILLFTVVLAIAYIARDVLIIFCFSILFAYLIDPVVRFLQRHSLFFKSLRGPHVADVVIPILAIFFLSDGETLVNQVIHLVATKDNYELLRSLATELNAMLHHYIKAKVTLSGLSFAYASTWLPILRFPHAVTLGLLAGILEFIPIAGWMTAAITIVSFGALAHTHWIWMAALLGIWRMLIDYWIAPRVLGHELEIHPLLAIFTLMVGGAVGGLVGVYLSLPFVAAIRVVWRRLGFPQAREIEGAPASLPAVKPGSGDHAPDTAFERSA